MKKLLPRFVALERRLAETRGGFSLFALFLREDAVDRWDLIVAAPWIEQERKSALPYITGEVQQEFSPEELSLLSRIVLVELANPAVEAINQALAVQHAEAEVRDSNFFGVPIKHAYIITSQRRKVGEQVVV